MKILVSACLLGEPCRYDGQSKPCPAVITLSKRHELIPVCPEVLGGLPTPRPASEIQTDGRIKNTAGIDVTSEYALGAKETLEIAKANNCTLAILKEKSPSCGHGQIYDGSFTKKLISGNGMTADLLETNGIRVIGEHELEQINEF